MAHVNHTNSSGVTPSLHNYPVDFNSNPVPPPLRFSLISYFLKSHLWCDSRQTVKRQKRLPAVPSSCCQWCPMWERLTQTRWRGSQTGLLRQRRRAGRHNRRRRRACLVPVGVSTCFDYLWCQITSRRFRLTLVFCFFALPLAMWSKKIYICVLWINADRVLAFCQNCH